MDQLEQYRQVIKNVLTHHYELVTNQSSEGNSSEVRDRLAFDDRYHNYLWFRFGWQGKQQVQYIIVYLSIKKGKIWVETDATNFGIVDELLAAGIPKTDIVLGFHPPHKRLLTEFAPA